MLKRWRRKTWAVFLGGAAFLMALMALLGYYAFGVTISLQAEIAGIHDKAQRSGAELGAVRSLIYDAALLVREAAINPAGADEATRIRELERLRDETKQRMAHLAELTGPGAAADLSTLESEIEQYWRQIGFGLSERGRTHVALDAAYLAEHTGPQRLVAQSIAEQINLLTRDAVREEAASRADSLRRARNVLLSSFAASFLAAVAGIALVVVRLLQLERYSEREKRRAEEAESEMRRLSRELVRAHEEERKAISRELHDEVGQTLTALRLTLGRAGKQCAVSEPGFAGSFEQAKELAEESLRAVRKLSLGLRPSMLDDLGLVAALEWQGREFTKHTGVRAEVVCDPELARLPDEIRTCLYRAAQEALTNCARHSKARNVSVHALRQRGRITLTVEDDGMGFESETAWGKGLGLIGMEERVKELGGRVSVASRLYLGTRVSVELPVREETKP